MLSTQIKLTNQSEHQKAWDLLPWYINRSLGPVEHAIVKNHIRTCITCRIELNLHERLFKKMQQTDLLQQVSHASFAQLKKRIETHPEVSASNKCTDSSKDLIFFPFQLQFLGFVKYTALAASLFLLAAPFMLNSWVIQPEMEGAYRTLANSSESTDNTNNIVRIVFADQPDSEQIEVIVNSVSGHIIKGPSPNGVYEVQIGNHQTDTQQVNDAIFRLRDHASVIFAELAQGLSVSE
ncbi:zf-HC2 domain-containing protein [uncultured Nitrosomonas sp.]|uniref:zf-HC2 domain-containing protein n=1 Tax=uncultured Nitrosomonas sp. TaxID=156424 RepID=UPI0025CD3308|nr:zf-HC2 domain-containing protein [uncultured Nitrosomonas sp.]